MANDPPARLPQLALQAEAQPHIHLELCCWVFRQIEAGGDFIDGEDAFIHGTDQQPAAFIRIGFACVLFDLRNQVWRQLQHF